VKKKVAEKTLRQEAR